MRLSFKKHVSAQVVPGEGTYVVSERGITAFDDERVAVVAPLLNGTRDFRTLVADVSGRCSPTDVAVAIGRLNAADLLAPAGEPAAGAPHAGGRRLLGAGRGSRARAGGDRGGPCGRVGRRRAGRGCLLRRGAEPWPHRGRRGPT